MTAEVTPVLDDSTLNAVIRPWWSIWAGLYWGFRKHACVLWCCAGRVDARLAHVALGIDTYAPVDVVVFYRELLVELTPEKELAQMIVDSMPLKERRHMKKRIYTGRQAFEAGEGRRTIAQLMNEVLAPNYLRLRESDDSDKTRIADSRNFAEGLRQSITLRSGEEPLLKTNRTPLILMSHECPSLIETIPSLESDDKRQEDTKIVSNEQDSIWEAAKTCFREYPHVIGAIPAIVKRQQAIAKGFTPMQRYLNMIEFDNRNNPLKRARRR